MNAKRPLVLAALSISLAGLLGAQAGAKYSVCVPQLSPASTELYGSLTTAVIMASGGTAEIQVLPFIRCINALENKSADLVSPTAVLPDKKKWAGLAYDYSSVEAFKIVFVLYANKSKSISAGELKRGNPKGYLIETDVSHVDYFPFRIIGSTSYAASLKKVDSGEIDAFIFAQPSCDASVKAQELKNIRRSYYDTFSCHFLIRKGGRGGKLDAALTDGLTKIKASGKYQQIMGEYLKTASAYIDWQP